MLAATVIDPHVSADTAGHFADGRGINDLVAWHEEVLDLEERTEGRQDAARWVDLGG